jgi:hypothetical protein
VLLRGDKAVRVPQGAARARTAVMEMRSGDTPMIAATARGPCLSRRHPLAMIIAWQLDAGCDGIRPPLGARGRRGTQCQRTILPELFLEVCALVRACATRAVRLGRRCVSQAVRLQVCKCKCKCVRLSARKAVRMFRAVSV